MFISLNRTAQTSESDVWLNSESVGHPLRLAYTRAWNVEIVDSLHGRTRARRGWMTIRRESQ